MHIAVCVKQIPDPEVAPSLFRIDPKTKSVIPVQGISPVISPFDEQAIEAALQIRDSSEIEIRITSITIGNESSRNIIKHSLALGVDDAIVLCHSEFEESDSYGVAYSLANAIQTLGDVDLVLTGRQAADFDSGVVGVGIAELLNIPSITFAKKIDVVDDILSVTRVLVDGLEKLEVSLPALVTVAHDIGNVRKASLRETMRAAKKPVLTWGPSDIGIKSSEIGKCATRRSRDDLFLPVNDSCCEFIGGDDPKLVAVDLVQRLMEEKII